MISAITSFARRSSDSTRADGFDSRPAAKVFADGRESKPSAHAAAAGVGAASGEGRDRGDHGREPGPKKRALGLEDHGQLPPELQRQVHAVVQQTKHRSGWPVRRTLRHLGVSPASYYRWRQEARRAKALPRSRRGRCRPTKRRRRRSARCEPMP